VPLIYSHFKRAHRWRGLSSWMGWDTVFFTCPNCNDLMFAHRVYKRYNCRVRCDSCNTMLTVVDSTRRCLLCGDRIECMATKVVIGKRYEILKESFSGPSKHYRML